MSKEGQQHAAAVRRYRGFLSYNLKGKDPVRSAQCGSLLDAYNKAGPEQKRQMVSSWLSSGGSKSNLETLLEQSMTHKKGSSDLAHKGLMTPGQVAEFCSMRLEHFPDLATFQAALQSEIDKNQLQHPPPSDNPSKETGSCFWNSRFYYHHDEATQVASSSSLEESILKKSDLNVSSLKLMENQLEQLCEEDAEKGTLQSCCW